jgi:general secretion pathway protein G
MKKSTKQNLIGVAVVLLMLSAFGGHAIRKTLAAQKRAKEVVLQQHLWVMRRAIDYYTIDKGKPPRSLEDLVTDGYLREIPADPFTGSNKTWIVQKQATPAGQESELGVADFHSGAPGADRSDKPYRDY